MPLRSAAKREYDRLWRQRKRSHGERGDKRGSGGEKGVVPDVVPHKKENVVPSWVSDFPNPFATKSARWALEYMAYINARGYTVDRETGEMVELLPGYMRRAEARERELVLEQRITLVEAELAALQASLPYQRAEAILDDERRELLEEEP